MYEDIQDLTVAQETHSQIQNMKLVLHNMTET